MPCREWFDLRLAQSGANVCNPVACCYNPVTTLCDGDCPCNNFCQPRLLLMLLVPMLLPPRCRAMLHT